MSVLRADGVTVKFGGLVAVQDVHFTVKQGEIYAVIGPNGAGKTTLFNAVTGIYAPTEGYVEFNGREIVEPLTGWVIFKFACAFSQWEFLRSSVSMLKQSGRQ